MPVQSYSQRTGPLLKTVNGQSRSKYDEEAQSRSQSRSTKSSLRTQIENLAKPSPKDSPPTPITVTATRSWKETHPPADDIELKLDMSDSEDNISEPGDTSRGHIAPSKFKKDKTRKQSPTENDSDDAATTKKRRIGAGREKENTKGAWRTRPSATLKKTPSSSENQEDPIFGDLKKPKTYGKSGTKPGAEKTFGSKAISSGSLQGKFGNNATRTFGSNSQNKVTKKPAIPLSQESVKSSGFQIPSSFDSPDKSAKKPKKAEKMEHFSDDDENPTPKPRAKFETLSSPVKDEQGREVEYLDFPSSPDAPRRKKKNKKPIEKEETPPPATQFIDFNDDVDFQVEDAEALDLDDLRIPETQAPSGFIDPVSLFPDDDDDPDADLDADLKAAVKETLCPWCSKPVSSEALEAHSKGKRMGVRQQQRFCRSHNRKTALDLYESKGYPTINWDDLPSRIEGHNSSLLPIINNTSPSHYRAVLARKIASGTDRAMKSDENLNPGYYGPRGFNLMCEILVQRWGGTLKEVAVKDRVISGRGIAYFIQSVLVAELASRLVSEDMGVELEEARGVLDESREIGEMVNEEDC